MIANIASATVRGAHGHPVTVEVHVGAGLPGSDASPHGDVVAALADGPATLDTLAARTMHSVADVACAVSDLVGAGLVVAEGGWVELAMSRLSGQHPS